MKVKLTFINHSREKMKKQFYHLILYSILVTFSSETYSENLEKEITVTASKLINNSMTGSSTLYYQKMISKNILVHLYQK